MALNAHTARRCGGGVRATRTRTPTAALAGVLLLLLACATLPCLGEAVSTPNYTAEQQNNTLAFLRGFATPAWGLDTAWTGTEFCTWAHVTCGANDIAVALETAKPATTATLPELGPNISGSLVLISKITAAGLGNKLSGTLPADWVSLSALTTLNVSGNALSGVLPPAWSALRDASTLDLSKNNLNGPLPVEWHSMSNLSYLYLNDNQLSGSIATTFGNMSMKVVDISNNNFCGCAPTHWNSSSSMTFTADPALRAANCSTANVCVPTTTTTTSTEAPTTTAPAKSRGRNLTALWAVIGAVGGCLVVAAVVLLVLWWRRRAAAAAAQKS